MMPAQPGRVLNRELLYTAVTRARTQVTLVASAPVLRGAIHTTTRRHSGLLARMAEVALVE
jgi:exodeoxyribonuclease V alpha subunit